MCDNPREFHQDMHDASSELMVAMKKITELCVSSPNGCNAQKQAHLIASMAVMDGIMQFNAFRLHANSNEEHADEIAEDLRAELTQLIDILVAFDSENSAGIVPLNWAQQMMEQESE